ncbi:alcohol dehydrogenase catalytic domain-containing protein [Amycolatopsis rhabdoformis]|uniref:alcohol dehydrogenase n=1 Tax=Amycolatopsis rhabdoformis TaxID=1448059 RepID=A0ABZ1IJQ1_9PSEU|nr:alcohol dehydrogenase catalytic domain-containing protein [Amycolatopsis rhabdoformis]WSE34492.1 alcohol dehydrogenase catalytic domain-containing protein [Amycolatopsis rhabdoformis]
MRAAVLTAPDRFELHEREVPEPVGDQLLVRVAACGICGHDVLARKGLLAAKPGQVLGHEIAGRVEAVGPSGDRSWLGKRVALVQRFPCGTCAECRAGHTNTCRGGPGFYGEDLPGGYAEFVLAGPANAVVLPDSIDDASGAILSCALGTGLHALRRTRATADDLVLVTGASGGVGVHTVRIAAALGATVIAVTSRAATEPALRASGAHAVVPVSAGAAGVREAAADLGRPRGVDVAIETTGTPTFALSLRALAPHGRLAVVGNTDPGAVEVHLGLVIVKELEIVGSAHADRQELLEVVDLVASGRVTPVPPREWPLAEVAAAHAALDSGALVGRAVVRP